MEEGTVTVPGTKECLTPKLRETALKKRLSGG